MKGREMNQTIELLSAKLEKVQSEQQEKDNAIRDI